MDAWETIVDKSSIDTGDAWDHINNLTGGTSGEIVFLERFEYELKEDTLDVIIEN